MLQYIKMVPTTLKTIALCSILCLYQVNSEPILSKLTKSFSSRQEKLPGFEKIDPEFAQILNHLRTFDTCKAIYTSKLHGYGVLEYTVKANNYKLKIHRLIHPSDFATGTPEPGTKKPYLLLHGLIGSSASYLRNVQDDYMVPPVVFDTDRDIERVMSAQGKYDYLHDWRSTADYFYGSNDKDTSVKLEGMSLTEKVMKDKPMKIFGTNAEINTDHDSLNFGVHFKKVHKKYELPPEAKKYITNSLAFTLSNFGYDVWLLNLRSNYYSREYDGRYSAQQAESPYWNFNIDTLVREDLMAVINDIKQISQWRDRDSLGLVSYSYSNAHILNLLTYPPFQDTLQPVVMMAPTLFTASVKDKKFKLMMNSIKKIMSKNGPFPSNSGKSIIDKLRGLICHLPVAKEFCRLLEMTLFGKTNKVTDVLSIVDNKKTALIKQDMDCGQTSLGVLHQILDNISRFEILPDYQPWVKARVKLDHRQPVRRSVILVHSAGDEIATPSEVEKIKSSALKMMTLADYSIKEPTFGHTDFLFSRKNKYLVNGEIARMVAVFDFLRYRKVSNQPLNSFGLSH